jgi:hypothetical protein
MKKRVQPIWFKAKHYGWGWYPVTWQGWGITLLFVCGYLFLFMVFLGWLGAATKLHAINYREISLSVFEYLGSMAMLSYLLIRVCSRYGEAPRWRWGGDD